MITGSKAAGGVGRTVREGLRGGGANGTSSIRFCSFSALLSFTCPSRPVSGLPRIRAAALISFSVWLRQQCIEGKGGKGVLRRCAQSSGHVARCSQTQTTRSARLGARISAKCLSEQKCIERFTWPRASGDCSRHCECAFHTCSRPEGKMQGPSAKYD